MSSLRGSWCSRWTPGSKAAASAIAGSAAQWRGARADAGRSAQPRVWRGDDVDLKAAATPCRSAPPDLALDCLWLSNLCDLGWLTVGVGFREKSLALWAAMTAATSMGIASLLGSAVEDPFIPLLPWFPGHFSGEGVAAAAVLVGLPSGGLDDETAGESHQRRRLRAPLP